MDREKFDRLRKEADRLNSKITELLPELAEARRRYATSKAEVDGSRMAALQAEATNLHSRFAEILDAMEGAVGVTPEVLEAFEQCRPPRADSVPRLARGSLTGERIESTRYFDQHLPDALDRILSLVPSSWLEREPRDASRLSALTESSAFLSLTKNCRRESEMPSVHRFRQAIVVCEDLLQRDPAYDHFAGAYLIPTIVQLASKLDVLAQVGGGPKGRLSRLWEGNSDGVDSTIFEVLTAAGCAELGRDVEFIPETAQKSADLRCHDPFPLVIECKLQRALSDYEIHEEAVIRDLFLRLHEEAKRRGIYGRFSLDLRVEARSLDLCEVVTALVAQRLARRPDENSDYLWGRVSFEQLPRRVALREGTRIYSPRLLEGVFGWDSDLPEWDGLCCAIGNAAEMVVNEVIAPLALVWTSSSPAAIRKRTWAPTNLFGQAATQVPGGDFGVVYVAYREGARESIADLRLQSFVERIQAWEHSASIRIPIAFLPRLYARALNDGQPDLIESTVQLLSGAYGERTLFEFFPATIYTRSTSSDGSSQNTTG